MNVLWLLLAPRSLIHAVCLTTAHSVKCWQAISPDEDGIGDRGHRTFRLVRTDDNGHSGRQGVLREVVGWEAQGRVDGGLCLHVVYVGEAAVGGLMELPRRRRQKGATPSGWDMSPSMTSTRRPSGSSGSAGAVYVPPTDSNIGRISVVADPQTAAFGLVGGLKHGGPSRPSRRGRAQVGWHELLGADADKRLPFTANCSAGRSGSETDPRPLSIVRRRRPHHRRHVQQAAREPVPFWLYYFDVDDIDAALRARERGRRQSSGPARTAGRRLDCPLHRPSGRDVCAAGKAKPGRKSTAGPGNWSGLAANGAALPRAARCAQSAAQPKK